MQSIQSRTRSVNIGEAFVKDGNAGPNVEDSKKILIKKANSVDIKAVLRIYGIKLDQYNKTCKCPFKFHSNDRTASFNLYDDTNSFYCFGCKSGGWAVNFVSLYEDISREDAAKKIADKFNIDVSLETIEKEENNYKEKRIYMLDFSNLMRSFIFDNLDDENALKYAEKISEMYDKSFEKFKKIDIAGFKKIIDKLKLKLEGYKFK